MVDCTTDLKSAVKHIEDIADNQQLDQNMRIKAHLLFGEFRLIANPGRGRRVTRNMKTDLLTRMNELINTIANQ